MVPASGRTGRRRFIEQPITVGRRNEPHLAMLIGGCIYIVGSHTLCGHHQAFVFFFLYKGTPYPLLILRCRARH